MDNSMEDQVDTNRQRPKPMITPTLVIGLGGTGVGALRFLKRRLTWLWQREVMERRLDAIEEGWKPEDWRREVWHRFEMEGGPPVIQLLGVDTLPWRNPPDETYLNDFEYAYLGGYNASTVLKSISTDPSSHPEISEWWKWNSGSGPGQIHSGARQIRAIGRLSFYRKYREFWSRLEPQIYRMSSIDAKQSTEDRGYLVSGGETKRVYIVSSFCGGTGAGLFMDVVACLRSVAHLRESTVITGIFALPSVFIPVYDSDLQKERVRANAYAALKEIIHFQSNPFHVRLPGEAPVDINKMYDRLYLVERVNEAGESLNSITDVQQLIANQIFLESMTDVGTRMWEYDVNVTHEQRKESGRSRNFIFSSFANSSLVVPRDEILEFSELRYAESLIDKGLLRKLTGDEENQLNLEVKKSLRDLENKITGMEAESESGNGEESDEEPGTSEVEAAAPVTPLSAELSTLEKFQQDLNRIVHEMGLLGAQHYLKQIKDGIDNRVAVCTAETNEYEAKLQQANDDYTQLQKRRPGAANWNVPPFSFFVRAIIREYERRLDAALEAIDVAKYELDDARRRLSTWKRLQEALTSLPVELEARVTEIQNTSKRFGQCIKSLFEMNRPSEQPHYEMFTTILPLPDIVARIYENLEKQFKTQAPIDTRYLISPQDKEGVSKPSQSVCYFHTRTAQLRTAGRLEHPTILQLAPLQIDLFNEIVALASRTIAAQKNTNLFNIRDILYTGGSKVQTRLRNLFDRCRPFWRYDLDIGGFSEKNMEQIIMVGVENKDEKNWHYLLRDYSTFQLVETNDPIRIDACRVRHGLPVEYLEALPDMKDKYDRLTAAQSGPLHLDGRWEPYYQGADKIIMDDVTRTPPVQDKDQSGSGGLSF